MHRNLLLLRASPAPCPQSAWTLRVSVTDRCQYRCAYCRPGQLSPYLPSERRLGVEDYTRLAGVFAQHPVTKIRFTGGEPLLRADLPQIIAAFRARLPNAELALTTNGQRVRPVLAELVDAGLTRATVHVDSLRPERYVRLMGDGDVASVLATTIDARRLLREVKLNVVIQRGRNEDEIGDFLAWSRATGIEVRFIELMNTGSAAEYTRSAFFSGREIVEAVQRIAGASSLPRAKPSDPAARFCTDDGVVFGVIASDTEPFCSACNRIRLTAGGQLLGCLYQPAGLDLRGALAQGDTALLERLVATALGDKRSYHPSVGCERARFSMAQTGG